MCRGVAGAAREPQARARRREVGEEAGGGTRPHTCVVQSRRQLARKVESTNGGPPRRAPCRSRPSARYACPPPAQSDTRASGWLTGPVWSRPCLFQAILAFSTGAAASGAGTFVIVHSIWQHAQLQGEAADARVTELRRLHGTHLETARPREVRASACSPSRIAPCQCSSLACMACALSRSRWPFPAYSTSGYDAI